MILAKRVLPYFISLCLWALIGLAIYGCTHSSKNTADNSNKSVEAKTFKVAA